MTTLCIFVIIVWASVMAYAAPAVLGMVRGQQSRRGDPMRLACFATGAIFVFGALRLLLAPDSYQLLAAILVLVIADALLILRLMRAYGRGGLV